ncbi:LLM class flavin-dependent oxidoreductase [Acholeplasma granularum]|uniref:LLM class flavin-dependent oxidoreductase n=1 Tax=Acholeplasma granularum TaxID=264635 RepID=UPI00047256A2|nr:LLM class flavin-dependent oxidoreductase [Acholeplasma granularum]
MKPYTFGLTTFLETGVDKESGMISHDIRINQAIEEIILADEVGLDYYGIGEHHRYDYAASSPQMILSAAAKLTKNIHLGSAVTVLSSADPVRIYEEFATLDILSGGRAEIMAGRGSFIESFPLFGYNLEDYDELFTEKLEMLLHIRSHEKANWQGTKHTPKLNNLGIYPRSVQDKLKISIAVGGTQSSIVRAAKLGLPLMLAIIGGNPLRFKPLIDLYKYYYFAAGNKEEDMEIGIHMHGLITDKDDKDLIERYYLPHHSSYKKIGEERGWQTTYKKDYLEKIKNGPLLVGHVDNIEKRIYEIIKGLGINRFLLHTPGSLMPHEDVIKTIELFGKVIVPSIKEKLKSS